MPDTPARTLILEALATAIEGMGPPTYFTDVRTVSRTMEFLGCPHPDQLPLVMLFPNTSTSEQIDGHRVIHTSLRIFVIGYIQAENQQDRDDRIAELEDDLLRLIMGTQRWGGTGGSYAATVEAVETSEADSDDNPIGWVGLVVRLDYEREITP